jgi:hypothetical protein
MTREQIIILGFIAGAFVAGWVASALIGLVARRRDASPAAPRPPLTQAVGDALENDRANDTMLSALGTGRRPALSDLEADLADWGFTYGVAWARAREEHPELADEEIADEALAAAEQVFRTYTEPEDLRTAVERGRNGAERSGGDAQTAHSPSPRTTS